jgi:O-antigen/teichoic acid export membrane protein
VIFLRLLTSFGINSALLRFLPDLRVVGNNRSTYALLAIGLLLRAMLYILPAALLLYWAGDAIAALLKLGDWDWILGTYLVVGFFRIMALFAAASLESLLWQKQSQYSIAAATLLRLIGVFYLLANDNLDLKNLVMLELITEALALAFLVVSGLLQWRSDPHRDEGTLATLRQDAFRYARFSGWAYLFNLTMVTHGSAPNRLIVSNMLGATTTALFGAIDRLIQFAKQYEPVKLLLGLVRPVFNAQYRSREDYPKIMSMGDGMFRLNLVVLMLPLLPIAIAGEYVFSIITAGKYAGAANLFLGFYLILILGSFMMVLELLVKAVEHTRIFVVSNLVLSASALVAWPFLDSQGLWALVVAISAGHVIAILIVVKYLDYYDFPVRIRWAQVAKICAAAAVAVVLGRGLVLLGLHELIGVTLALVVYVASMLKWMPFSNEEQELFKQMFMKKLRKDVAK